MGTVCLTHRDCADGMMSAWVVRQRFPDAEVLFCDYHDALPDIPLGSDVIITDFSYAGNELLKFIVSPQVKSLLLLDHHPRSKEIVDNVLNGLAILQNLGLFNKPVGLYYDASKSGALMAWMHFFPDKAVPEPVAFVSDRDLWQFKLPKTKDFMAGLLSYPLDLNVWSNLLCQSSVVEVMLAIAPHAVRIQQAAVGWAIEHTLRTIEITGLVTLDDNGIQVYEAPLINCAHGVTSDACALLAKDHLFAMAYYDTTTHRKFSLRSNGFDCQLIANFYCGGGHAKAAGFAVPRNHPLATI